MVTIEYTGRRGCLTGIAVCCETVEQAQGLASMSTYWSATGLTVAGYGSKQDVRQLQAAVDEINRRAAKLVIGNRRVERVLVAAGRYKIGDTVAGNPVTSFSPEFTPNSDHFSAHGIDPWATRVCYAYFN